MVFNMTGMNGLPQNVLLNFRLEFPKTDLTIYLPYGISEILCQMVRTPGLFTIYKKNSGNFGWEFSFGKNGYVSFTICLKLPDCQAALDWILVTT